MLLLFVEDVKEENFFIAGIKNQTNDILKKQYKKEVVKLFVKKLT